MKCRLLAALCLISLLAGANVPVAHAQRSTVLKPKAGKMPKRVRPDRHTGATLKPFAQATAAPRLVDVDAPNAGRPTKQVSRLRRGAYVTSRIINKAFVFAATAYAASVGDAKLGFASFGIAAIVDLLTEYAFAATGSGKATYDRVSGKVAATGFTAVTGMLAGSDTSAAEFVAPLVGTSLAGFVGYVEHQMNRLTLLPEEAKPTTPTNAFD